MLRLHSFRSSLPIPTLILLLNVLQQDLSHFIHEFHLFRWKTEVYLDYLDTRFMGGGVNCQTLNGRTLLPYCAKGYELYGDPAADFEFVQYVTINEANIICNNNLTIRPFTLPIYYLSKWLTRDELRNMSTLHNVKFTSKHRKSDLYGLLNNHLCDICDHYVSLFIPLHVPNRNTNRSHKRDEHVKSDTDNLMLVDEKVVKFPPLPPPPQQIEQIINDFCADTTPSSFEESGCAVCGQLIESKQLTPIQNCACDLNLLAVDGVSRKQRMSSTDPIQGFNGPVIDETCQNVCLTCIASLQKRQIPKHALASGLWLGTIPNELKDLTFAEKMMIARVRHNRAVIRVSSGRVKMIANVIMFSNPTVTVYHKLPPSREEMNEVLACIFTGSAQPSDEDFKRTPFLVRRAKVSLALDWLKLNHCDYKDLEISQENLNSYPLAGVPVVVDYKKTIHETSNKLPAAMSVHDMEEEEGNEEGVCPFTVHGITGDEYTNLSMTQLKARALKHLNDEGKVLGIGHEDTPQSIYDNPQAYPQMFPWLFPYGYGGIGQEKLKKRISEVEHKKHLLMYHDKRFQTDLYFPIVAFNHQQLKAGITGSFLLAKKNKFKQISERLMSLDQNVLSQLIKRLTDGENFHPETDAEKTCFSVLNDLDHVGGHVKGSLTSKKYMRQEIWSLISFLGAPSWFITLSPADNRHPICLYFADTGEKFCPELRNSSERNRLIANNPVAAARFFDLMVRSFIKNVLGVDHDHPGLYGKTSGHYGTVEQQGRLTLHLHLLLWIAGALSPQEIRDRLMSKDSIFQRELVEYLESVHQGEFLSGSMDSVRESIPTQPEVNGGIHALLLTEQTPCNLLPVSNYKDPTQILPVPAPLRCSSATTCNCGKCKSNDSWWSNYYKTVDDLILKSNVHRCTTSSATRQAETTNSSNTATSTKIVKGPKGCLDRNGVCRARFPREIQKTTTVDSTDGHINMKKLESYINMFTPCLTYLIRSNTDVTNLSSGTSIKAIVSYISDYITKPTLKSHQIFSSMYDVFERNKVQIGTNLKTESDASRRLILKIVNSLNAKMEIGSPMASMYLLGNPDHYTGHDFVCFWWKSYVTYLNSNSDPDNTTMNNTDGTDDNTSDQVKLGREEGVYIATTNVDDYKYRPNEYQHISLYEWTQSSHKRRARKKEVNNMQTPSTRSHTTKNTYHQFTEGHPMRATHLVKCDFDRLLHVVPNFLGGVLPRHDSGNREYYCCTMLTLFFPWRDALCIKQPSDSWETAFNAFKFSTRQIQLIQNFNLRYECLDARDDFHAQLKKKSKQRTPWQNGGDSDVESDTDYVKMPPNGQIEHGVEGKLYTSSIRMMDSISAILRNAGWLQQCSYVMHNAYVRCKPKQVPGTSWSNIVKNRCNAMFKDKFTSYIPPIEGENITQQYKPCVLVRLLTAEYFRRNFKAEKKEANDLIDATVALYSLNEEQERAFRIIANHISAPETEQLKMYLGGMGGTGKSRVIKAIIHLLSQRKEDHRFTVLAPTGTAAALLNGSTYHKALGIYRKNDVGLDFSRSESAILNDVRARLQGVQYLFIDEISMIACHELYSISARLAQITGMHDMPFGGMNIVLAGDFAQLAPVFGAPLYDGHVHRFVDSKMSVRSQETVIGKVLWHQITTVVILVQNMRQNTQTEPDGKLRTALENMRYAACTPEDIAFMRTLIPGVDIEFPSLNHPMFRNVSIITARNNQRDRINEEGSQRFAADCGIHLTHFYSLDELAGGNHRKVRRKRKREQQTFMKEPTLSGLTQVDQEALWHCYPHMSDHIPGKLSLCIGMPVMIRSNEATELCVTKGQQAAVVGWDAYEGPYGRLILDTLFVQLINPPKQVQLVDLPTNVIPLTKITTSIECRAKSDQSLQIKRQQVPILLNFAMTDYASQGMTRINNVVDPGYLRDHLSFYTALSRSSSAAGTVLIQDFSVRKITCGISGWLRQEFRELNVLDETTRLRYENCLPDGIFGPLRNPLVRAYYVWIKNANDDTNWHSAIQHRPGEQKIRPVEADATWDYNMFKALRKVDQKPANLVHREANPPAKIIRLQPAYEPANPLGLTWDSDNYSCAYDTLFTILYNIWTDAPTLWSHRFADLSVYLKNLSSAFPDVRNHTISLEMARDTVRLQLNQSNPTRYPTGTAFTCLATLTDAMMTNHDNRLSGKTFLKCRNCNYKKTLLRISECFQLNDTGPFRNGRQVREHLSDSLGWHLSDEQKNTHIICDKCKEKISDVCHTMVFDISVTRLPYIMCILLNEDLFSVDQTLTYQHDMVQTTFKLRGLIYGDGNHFDSRFITKDGDIWYHDGITTKSNCKFEANVNMMPDNGWLMSSSKGFNCRKAVLAVYTRE